jgi:hypothetical protein
MAPIGRKEPGNFKEIEMNIQAPNEPGTMYSFISFMIDKMINILALNLSSL